MYTGENKFRDDAFILLSSKFGLVGNLTGVPITQDQYTALSGVYEGVECRYTLNLIVSLLCQIAKDMHEFIQQINSFD